ncbi:hypothetical protein U1Q18_038802 [Sarracenia purpurea var. burkii]
MGEKAGKSTLMRSTMERRRDEADQFNLKEWTVKARVVSRENTHSRRFSVSNLRSFREDHTRSFRSNFTISSTASSPGYTLREEIDPSTYSFTAALKGFLEAALQARNVYSLESLSPDGFALNSKWNEAEKYICNPLSGEVPMECLSAKTLSGRSFRGLAGRITMSAPLIYPSHSHGLLHSKPSLTEAHFPLQEKNVSSTTRDVGTQSTPPELSSSSPSPAPTPSIEERSIKRSEAEEADEAEDSASSNLEKLMKLDGKVEVKETREEEETKGKEQQEDDRRNRKAKQFWWCCCYCCCLSWTNLWIRKWQRQKKKKKKKKQKPTNQNLIIQHLNAC